MKIEIGIDTGESQHLGAGVFIGAIICLVLGALAPILGIEWWQAILFAFGAQFTGTVSGRLFEFVIRNRSSVLAPFCLIFGLVLPIATIMTYVQIVLPLNVIPRLPFALYSVALLVLLCLGITKSRRLIG